MDRTQQLLKFVTKNARGIEIGPFFNPLVPKSAGYQSVSIDVLTQEELRQLALNDPGIPNEAVQKIESVDLVGPAQDIESLVKDRFGDCRFDYIVSSHNLEHIPDPIRFLQGCRAVLKPGGYLSLALPDYRCCFDYFLPKSTIADWLEAYFERRSKPSDKQVFMRNFMRAERRTRDETFSSFDISTHPSEIFPIAEQLELAFDLWNRSSASGQLGYVDAHCWMFTPTTFKLIILDLQYLSLLPFVIESLHGPYGNEFYAHLKADDPVIANYETQRIELCQQMMIEDRIDSSNLRPSKQSLLKRIFRT